MEQDDLWGLPLAGHRHSGQHIIWRHWRYPMQGKNSPCFSKRLRIGPGKGPKPAMLLFLGHDQQPLFCQFQGNSLAFFPNKAV